MKRIFIITILLSMFFVSSAQRRTEVGVSSGGGYLFPQKVKNEFSAEQSSTLNLGVYVTQPIFKSKFIESGVFYNFETTKLDALYMAVDYNLPLSSFEVPLNVGWQFKNQMFTKVGVSALWLTQKEIEEARMGVNWQACAGYDFIWVKMSLTYQQAFKNTEGTFRNGNKGFGIEYKRRIIKLEANIPISKFLRE